MKGIISTVGIFYNTRISEKLNYLKLKKSFNSKSKSCFALKLSSKQNKNVILINELSIRYSKWMRFL